MAKKKEEAAEMLTARVPARLMRQLDKHAAEARRSRTAEVIVRLERSLKAGPQRSAA